MALLVSFVMGEAETLRESDGSEVNLEPVFDRGAAVGISMVGIALA